MSHSGLQAKVPLHPVASRHGQQTSTLVSVKLSAEEATRRSQPPCGSNDTEGCPSSSPTTRGPCSPVPHASHLDDATWGLQHSNLDQYGVLDDGLTPLELREREQEEDLRRFQSSEARRCWSEQAGSRAPPVRSIDAHQLQELFGQYTSLDTPHSVVFPFLHGVDGTNIAQNLFFGASRYGIATPRYRGLTIVRADMPTAEEQAAMRRLERHRGNSSASSSASSREADPTGLGIAASLHRDRAFSTGTSRSIVSTDSSSSSNCDTDEDAQSSVAQAGAVPIQGSLNRGPGLNGSPGRPRAMTSSTSSASITSSNVSGPSLFSLSSTIDSVGSQTSIGSTSDVADEGAKHSGKSGIDGTSRRHSSSTPYQAQPMHSMLNSTVFPAEVLSPPSFRRIRRGPAKLDHQTCTGYPDDEGESDICRTGANFIVPPQASGVSLRNFKMQCAKYATISDIVVYCPSGYHAGMLRLAQWFREAQDAMWIKRHNSGRGGLKYNVFVVMDPFEAFEQNHPELVAVDSSGFSRNRVDFVDRERDEMQRLTQASEIDDNVWLGCTADAPGTHGSESNEDEPLTPSDDGNPHGFAICIEAHDNASMPNKARLSHASHYLDAVEATALFELDSRQALRKLTEDEDLTMDDVARRIYNDDKAGSLVLGPHGWTPAPCGSARSGGLTNVPLTHRAKWIGNNKVPIPANIGPCDQHSPLMLDSSNVIHLECLSTCESIYHGKHDDASVQDVLTLCAWIKKQAAPAVATARSGFVPAHRPRRVLFHCGDGYTETSIMALAYLMYSRGMSLPEAYLDLQLRAKRSFFVYERDVPFLKRIEASISEDRKLREKLLGKERDRERDADLRVGRVRHAASKSYGGSEDRLAHRLGLSRSSGTSRRSSMSSSASDPSLVAAMPPVEQGVWARSLAAATGLVSGASGHSLRKTPSNSRLASALPSRARTPTPRDDRQSGSPEVGGVAASKAQPERDFRWFYDTRFFEGSFPSRILPFLYLGNLNHALNAHMLHALGITHVVSVGESAIAPATGIQNGKQVPTGQSSAQPPISPTHNSLSHEHAEGRIGVLDLRNVSDDGIDPLRSTMREAVEYIERARRSGGKVLVHCRVGVSRSTTIVLAYVMAHLDLSLVESYLLVRSRRLNILVQPHLLFFWELRGWETFLAKEKARHAGLLRRAANRSVFESPDSDRTRQIHGSLSRNLASLTVRSDCSGSYRSAISSPSASPLMLDGDELPAAQPPYIGPGADNDVRPLDVDFAAGAGSAYGFKLANAELLPFGSGSLAGVPYSSMRLLWGHFAREIADLNSRYFV